MHSQLNNLSQQYLLATPSLQDPLFASSVVYLCEHSNDGSMGMIINQQSDQTLNLLFEQLGISCDNESILDTMIFIGGPVQTQQGFVLHSEAGNWDKSIKVGDNNYLTSSRDILEAIAQNRGPQHYLVLLGFSGWAPGQLAQELQENAWLTARSTPEITYSPDIAGKWKMAFDSLGFDLDNLSPTAGNA